MPDRPKLLCPQCGADLRGTSSQACPECGFYVGPARTHYRGTLYYWRYLRSRRWLDALATLLLVAAFCVGLWIISFNPLIGFAVLTAAAGAAVVGLGKYLSLRRKRRS
jgi:hypothetical protein